MKDKKYEKFDPPFPVNYTKKKCEKCNIETDEIVWVKRMVYICKYSQNMDEEMMQDGATSMIYYGRKEFLELVKNDVKHNKNEGEWFSCENCFKEMDK